MNTLFQFRRRLHNVRESVVASFSVISVEKVLNEKLQQKSIESRGKENCAPKKAAAVHILKKLLLLLPPSPRAGGKASRGKRRRRSLERVKMFMKRFRCVQRQ